MDPLKFHQKNIMPNKSLLVAVVIAGIMITGCFAVPETPNHPTNITLSRRHICVWFDYSVRFYDHEADNAYSQSDLRTMITVISKRFSKLAIDSAPILDSLPPGNSSHSRLWIPQVVAQHNKDNPAPKSSSNNITGPPPMEIIVSFDISKVARTKQVTSFDVAKWMADSANRIFPGTVKTLMMYPGFTVFSSYYNVHDTIQMLKVAKEKISGGGNATGTTATFNYNLAVFLDLKDCGHFKGPLGEKAKDILPHVDTLVTLLRPNYHQMTFTPEVIHKMFTVKFEDCERKLKKEREGIKVIPAVLWMARKGTVKGMVEGWGLMSEWGRKRDKEVIMFEAFDTPNGRLLSDQGWWRLKDEAEHEIKVEGFVEKIEEMGGKDKPSNLFPLWEESSDESGGDGGRDTSGDGGVIIRNIYKEKSLSTEDKSGGEVYIVLVLLSVICTLLVALVLGLVYGFRKMVIVGGGVRMTGGGIQACSCGGDGGGGGRRRSGGRWRNGGYLSTRFVGGGGGSHEDRERLHDGDEGEEGEEISTPPGGRGNGICGDVSGREREGGAGVLEIRDTAPIVAVTYKK